MSTAWRSDFSSMPAMMKSPLSMASGRSVEVRIQMAGKVAHTGEEAAFFGKCAAIAHHCKGVHLKAVIVVETEWLVLNHALIEFEARGCKAVAAAWVAS